MKTSFFATLSLIALNLAPLAPAAFAESQADLDLVCIAKANTRTGIIVRQILVGNERRNTTLEDSRGHKVTAKKFAVVIELIGGENGQPPREEWEILTNREFTVKETSKNNYRVVDLKNRFDYTCSTNGEVRINPALTRTN